MPLLQRDELLTKINALPNGAAGVNGSSIDLRVVSGDFWSQLEAVLEAPALTTGQLPDTQTITYKIEHSDDNATFSTLFASVIVQTGAGGAGAAANSFRTKLPAAVKRYVRAVATKTGAADSSAKSSTFYLVF
jgi:hypothetical protein